MRRDVLVGRRKLCGQLRIDGGEIVFHRLQRRVNNAERDVTEERLILVVANKFDNTLGHQIIGLAFVLRAKFPIVPP